MFPVFLFHVFIQYTRFLNSGFDSTMLFIQADISNKPISDNVD